MFLKRALLLALLIVTVLSIVSCGTIQHSSNFTPSFTATPGTRIAVEKPTNNTGESFDVDIVGMVDQSLKNALAKQNLLQGSTSDCIELQTSILGYSKGNAFKRWLLPGWGTTVLEVHCTLVSKLGGEILGSIDAKRTVSMGGGYSIGAWRTICDSVAKDIVEELQKKI